MSVRGLALVLAAAVGLAAGPSALGASKQVRVRLARTGNVTVAQLTLARSAGATAAPRLRVANARALGSDVAVLATKPKKGKRSKATVTIVHRHRSRRRGITALDLLLRARVPAFVVLTLPQGYTATRVALAANVVQENPRPPFACSSRAAVSGLHVGTAFRRTSLNGLARAACLLALDRPAPLAALGPLGAEYCAVGVGRATASALELGLTLQCDFAGIDFVQLDFGNDLTLIAQLPFAGAQCRFQSGLQECAFPGGLRKGIAYRESVAFDRPPPAGKEVLLRVSMDGGRTFEPLRFAGPYPR
ncbi:MAG: hypothetical protein H0V84_07725 [Actinobacteria bacterium]|nr:hypothetical protein [Actinomycetota bacterium]